MVYCQWDQFESVYQFNWNFTNLEVSPRIIFVFFNYSVFCLLFDLLFFKSVH